MNLTDEQLQKRLIELSYKKMKEFRDEMIYYKQGGSDPIDVIIKAIGELRAVLEIIIEVKK
ncbi:MAG: hypothetical protein KA369_08475 [Spirochaetes bacterium]|nr:hypothetical protein [Spirochaetota bacterium]